MRLLNIEVPCDQCIIRNAKVYYRNGLVNHCLKSVNEKDEITWYKTGNFFNGVTKSPPWRLKKNTIATVAI